MPRQAIKQRLISLFLAAAVLIPAGLLLAPVSWGRIAYNTIDSVARIGDNGRQVIVTGPIECDGGQRSDLRVTVTQRTTGAVAEGRTVITCSGGQQQWEVRASTQGNKTFEAGPAIAVALATTSIAGETDDAHQWLVNITLTGP